MASPTQTDFVAPMDPVFRDRPALAAGEERSRRTLEAVTLLAMLPLLLA